MREKKRKKTESTNNHKELLFIWKSQNYIHGTFECAPPNVPNQNQSKLWVLPIYAEWHLLFVHVYTFYSSRDYFAMVTFVQTCSRNVFQKINSLINLSWRGTRFPFYCFLFSVPPFVLLIRLQFSRCPLFIFAYFLRTRSNLGRIPFFLRCTVIQSFLWLFTKNYLIFGISTVFFFHFLI